MPSTNQILAAERSASSVGAGAARVVPNTALAVVVMFLLSKYTGILDGAQPHELVAFGSLIGGVSGVFGKLLRNLESLGKVGKWFGFLGKLF